MTRTVGFFPSKTIRLGAGAFFHRLRRALGNEISLRLVDDPAGVAEPDPVCLVAVAPMMEDVSAARSLIGRLLLAGIRRDRIWPVVWHAGWPNGLPPEVMEEHVGPFIEQFPFDAAGLGRFENGGDVASTKNSKFKWTVPIERLAKRLTDVPGEEQASPPAEKEESSHRRDLEKTVTANLFLRFMQPGTDPASLPLMIEQEINARVLANPGIRLSDIERVALQQNIVDYVTGLGPLEPFMRDSRVNEIMVNGLKGIFVERDGVVEDTDVRFESEAELKVMVDRVVARMGRRVDWSSPFCDLRLVDGSRVNVVLPPVSLEGPLVTIRRFRAAFRSLEDLIGGGSLTPAQADQLRQAVHDRKNILVAGNSGSGKTTLLNILAGLAGPSERVVTMEDAAELRIERSHVVRLETRPPNAEGSGEIKMSDLVVNALRMRPDRLVVGECRGGEIIPMLQAMNTGHKGSMTTVHANSAQDAIKRVESMVLLHAPEWPMDVVREQIKAGLDLVLFLKRDGAARRLASIEEVACLLP